MIRNLFRDDVGGQQVPHQSSTGSRSSSSIGGNSSSSGVSVASTSSREAGFAGSITSRSPLLAHHGILAGELELARNHPDGLVAAVPEQLDASLAKHCRPRRPILKHRSVRWTGLSSASSRATSPTTLGARRRMKQPRFTRKSTNIPRRRQLLRRREMRHVAHCCVTFRA